MDITPVTPITKLILKRYGDGGFVINEDAYKGNLLILPEQVLPWDFTGMESLFSSLQPVIKASPLPEILLIGWGKTYQPIPADMRAALRAEGISADGMDTGAACRTYNVLLAEGRNIAAALIAAG